MANDPGPAAASFTGRGSSGNSPEQNESGARSSSCSHCPRRSQGWFLAVSSLSGTAAPTAYSCSTAWNVNHNLRMAPLGLYISCWPPNPRGSQHSFGRVRGFLREGKELPRVEVKPLRVQLCCSAQFHSEPQSPGLLQGNPPKWSNSLMSRLFLKILRNLHKS